MVGTGSKLETKDSECPGQAAPKHVFVARTAMSTTKETVEGCLDYLAGIKGVATCCTPEERIQSGESFSLSWRVQVDNVDYEKALLPTSWKSGWAVKPYYFRRKRPDNKQHHQRDLLAQFFGQAHPATRVTKSDTSPVTILSYNSTGYPVQRQSYSTKLQIFSDVICGQEHFQLKNCKFRVANSFNSNFDLFFKPAVKSSSNLGQGRPKGGLYIAWKKVQVKKATRLMCDNFRLQAVILEYQNCKILLINTYFPCDSQKLILNEDESSELQKLLIDISSLRQKYRKKFDTAMVLGDLNYDDHHYTGHTQAINNFLENERLSSVWDFYPVDFTFSSGNSRSIIDHFLISNTQSGIILEAGVIHDPENMSGHCPVYIKVDLAKANNPPEKVNRNPRLNWSRSSPEQKEEYAKQLGDHLSQQHDLSECLHCDDVLCDQESHRQEIDLVASKLLGALVDSAWENLDTTKGTTGDQSSREYTIPGWNDMVKPYQGESRFWYCLWTSAGKPIHSSTPGIEHDLFINMKHSKNQYHFAVRRAQNNLKLIQNDKLISKMNSPEIFDEIKQSCKLKNSDLPSVIDDVHGSQNISNHFKNIYESLYKHEAQ